MEQKVRTPSTSHKPLYKTPTRRRGLKRFRKSIPPTLLGVALGLCVAWAGWTVLHPSALSEESRPSTYAQVKWGELVSTLELKTEAKWEQTPVASNLAAGVVTDVTAQPGNVVEQGTILYSVNLRPTVAAAGAVPAFRDLSVPALGADVRQLEEMLVALGFQSSPADDVFDAQTSRSVMAWQKSLGVDPTGVVLKGDVLFIPTMPASVVLDPAIVRGRTIGGGEPAVNVVSPEPTFVASATDAQVAKLQVSMPIEISSPASESVWQATIGAVQAAADTGGYKVPFAAVDGSAICGDDCKSVPLSGTTVLRSRAVLLEPVAGLMVPTAALSSAADGTVHVVDSDGVEHAVKVIAGAQGFSIVEGISDGLTVRMPATRSGG